MSVLLIDNNDSFTYNIVETIRSVCSDKWQIVRSEVLDIGMLDRFSHIVISPGPMTPSDFPILSDVICRCYDHSRTFWFSRTISFAPDLIRPSGSG